MTFVKYTIWLTSLIIDLVRTKVMLYPRLSIAAIFFCSLWLTADMAWPNPMAN